MLTIVMSSSSMKTPTQTTASVHHLRSSAAKALPPLAGPCPVSAEPNPPSRFCHHRRRNMADPVPERFRFNFTRDVVERLAPERRALRLVDREGHVRDVTFGE